jgi:hypothetical protein
MFSRRVSAICKGEYLDKRRDANRLLRPNLVKGRRWFEIP